MSRVWESASALQPAVERRIKMVVLHCSAGLKMQPTVYARTQADHLRRGYDGASTITTLLLMGCSMRCDQ